jgi:DNA-binding MarR family transcriptional regulator
MNDRSRCADNPCPVTFALVRAAKAAESRVESSLDRLGLSMAKIGVLRQLVVAGEPVALGQLAERNACVKSNMTQLVDRLEADGLVTRTSDPADRRSVLAAITEEGRRRYEEASRLLAEREQTLVAELGARGASDVLRLLGRVGFAR